MHDSYLAELDRAPAIRVHVATVIPPRDAERAAGTTTVRRPVLDVDRLAATGTTSPASTTSSTAVNINIPDSAARKSGCWAYRGVITREALHHNWGTTTKYGESASFCG